MSGTLTGNNAGYLAGTIRGATTIENVVIDMENHSAQAGGIIARNAAVATGITLKNVLINVQSSTSSGTNGLLFGNYGASSTIVVDGVHIVDLATASNKINALSNSYVTYDGTVNTYTSASSLSKDSLPTDFLKAGYDLLYASAQ